MAARELRQAVYARDVGSAGWALVISDEGYLVVHPNSGRLQDSLTVFDLADQAGDPSIRDAANRALDGESGFLERDAVLTGQASWVFYEPVKEARWSLVVFRVKEEILEIDSAFRRRVIWILGVLIPSLLCLVAMPLVQRYEATASHQWLWALSLAASLIFLAGGMVLRYVIYHQAVEKVEGGVPTLDAGGLEAFLASQARQRDGERTVLVPAGVFIETMEFRGARDLFVSGMLWQKLEHGNEYEPGFVLPDAKSVSLTESYRRPIQDGEVVGWFFEAVVSQDLDTSRYPFDHDVVSLRLWHRNFHDGVALTPDLDAYTLTSPTARPGLDSGVTVPGFFVASSFFDYRAMEYNTDFGDPASTWAGAFPELHFNVSLKRNLLDVAITSIIPILIVLSLLFAVLLTTSDDPEHSSKLGFNPAGVMRIASALFFVVLLTHIQVRNALQVRELVFLEYSFFVTYLTVLFVSAYTFVFTLKSLNLPFLYYENGLLVKLSYWPLLLAYLFVASAIFFY